MKKRDHWFSGALGNRALFVSMLAAMAFVMLTVTDPAESFAGSPSSPVFQKVPGSQYPLFSDDLDFEHLAEAISGSISYYEKLPLSREFSFGRDSVSNAHLIRSLKNFLTFVEKKPSEQALSGFIAENYDVYSYIHGGAVHDVLFTGYYEPLLHGSRKRSEMFRYPVYSRPDDLVTVDISGSANKAAENSGIGRYDGDTFVPYYTRQQISGMAVSEMRATPIAWVNDPVALFFLEIQGSGKIRLENGETINVHYQISNGHPYKSIGKYLIDHKKLSKESVSMQSIREYLHAHPDEREDIFNYNPRFIFFETVENGPVGCFNIELTPGRSVALDRKIAPAGALVFVRAEKPIIGESGQISAWTGFSRFLLNQDTGSAINGPGRADIFWGNGPYAELAAGYMKHSGTLYFLVLKPRL